MVRLELHGDFLWFLSRADKSNSETTKPSQARGDKKRGERSRKDRRSPWKKPFQPGSRHLSQNTYINQSKNSRLQGCTGEDEEETRMINQRQPEQTSSAAAALRGWPVQLVVVVVVVNDNCSYTDAQITWPSACKHITISKTPGN